MVWQFAYIHRVVGISLFIGKNTIYDIIVFSLKKQHKTLISKTNIFSFLCTGFIMGYKQAKKFSMRCPQTSKEASP